MARMLNRHTRQGIAVLWFSVSICLAAIAQDGPRLPDLTKVDLFPRHEWTSLDISVGGFSLGMTKEDVGRLSKEKGYKILDTLGQRQECTDKHCEVYSLRVRPVGIRIVYGDDGRLAEIDIYSICVYSDTITCRFTRSQSQWTADLTARRFHGNTYRLFNQFSEKLCRQLLGPATQKKTATNLRVTDVLATYDKLGIVVRYTIHRRTAVEYTGFEMSFVQPNPRVSAPMLDEKGSH